jgi:hypothetical protein
MRDVSNGFRFNPDSHERFHNAARGWNSELGDKEAYRASYRVAYEAGYRDGFNSRVRPA